MSELVQTNMSKLVQNQYDTNCYDSQTCLNLFRINMIRIDTILKHVKTRNENMTKYSKIEQMVHEMFALTTTK